MSVLATDNFNRANENPISDGGAWTSIGDTGNDFEVVTNQATAVGVGADAGNLRTGITWPNDQYSQCKFITPSNAISVGNGAGCVVRGATGASRTQYECIGSSGIAGTALAKRVSGTYTSLASTATTWATNDIMYCEVRGSALVAKKNGSTTGMPNATDSAIASGTAGLFNSVESGSNNPVIDDWEGGDFAGPFPPWPARPNIFVIK